MIDLYGVLQEQETINGELGLGVDYYKGETGAQGIPGKDGKDGVNFGVQAAGARTFSRTISEF